MNNLVIGCALILALIFDLKTKKVPNILNLYLLLYSIYYYIGVLGNSFVQSILIIIISSLFVYPLYLSNMLGAGDVKLFIAMRLCLDFNIWVMIILSSIMLGCVVFILKLIWNRELKFDKLHYYRFTPYIVVSYLIVILVNGNFYNNL